MLYDKERKRRNFILNYDFPLDQLQTWLLLLRWTTNEAPTRSENRVQRFGVRPKITSNYVGWKSERWERGIKYYSIKQLYFNYSIVAVYFCFSIYLMHSLRNMYRCRINFMVYNLSKTSAELLCQMIFFLNCSFFGKCSDTSTFSTFCYVAALC